jgi:hypothetical protein
MRVIIICGAVIACAVGLSFCGWDKAPPATPDQPCGLGVVCFGADAGPTGTCCPEYSICGGDPAAVGCPDGMCCDVGSPDAPGFGKRAPMHQFASDAGAR